MGCRVGMSRYPHTRIGHWVEKEGHTGSEILASGLTYDEATAREKKEAEKRGCVQSAGGQRDGKHDWSVYHVWGGKTG